MARSSSTGNEFISIDWHPDPLVLTAQFYSAATVFNDFRDPLNRAVEEIIAPSIGMNFNVGGRPAWVPLADSTLLRDSYDGSERQGILWKTGTLKEIAESVRPWSIDNDTAFLVAGNLGDAWYGIVHQGGSQWIPARPWAVLQPEDEEAIEELIGNWTFGAIVEVGLWGRAIGGLRRLFGRR